MWATGVQNSGRIRQGPKEFINEINDGVKSHNDSWPSINFQTTDNMLNCYLQEDVPLEQDIVWLYYVNENTVETSADPNFNRKPTL